MLKKIYLHKNGIFRLWVPRAGSSSLSHMQLLQEFPDIAKKFNYPNPDGKFRQPETILPSNWVNSVPKGTAVIVRDPIDRFISGCQLSAGRNFDELLNLAKNPDSVTSAEKGFAYHLAPISYMINDGCKYFKFPDKLGVAAKYLGLHGNVPELKLPLTTPKPTLTDSQLEKVKEVFSDDIKLFSSL